MCHAVEYTQMNSGRLKEKNLFENKTLQLGRYLRKEYTDEFIYSVYLHNARKVVEVLPFLVENGVRLYRLSSALMPLADKVHRSIWDTSELRGVFKSLGDYCRKNAVRVGMHPAQFCVLNSESPNVIQNAIEDLKLHAYVLDACEFDESPKYYLNIHAGRRGRGSELIETIKTLPGNIRSRLTLENCETVANVEDLLEIHGQTGVPIVCDSHHHTFNRGSLSLSEALSVATATWPSGIKPLQHIANTEPGFENGSFTERRKHSLLIHQVPSEQLKMLIADEVDCEVEAKAKQLAVYKMSLDFKIPL